MTASCRAFHEPERDVVFKDVVGWLDERARGASARVAGTRWATWRAGPLLTGLAYEAGDAPGEERLLHRYQQASLTAEGHYLVGRLVLARSGRISTARRRWAE